MSSGSFPDGFPAALEMGLFYLGFGGVVDGTASILCHFDDKPKRWFWKFSGRFAQTRVAVCQVVLWPVTLVKACSWWFRTNTDPSIEEGQ